MYDIHNIISDIELPSGHTKRMNCPNCGGYNTFTVTNNMGNMLWNCYKASCNLSGTKRVGMSNTDIVSYFSDVQQFAEEAFEMPSYVVPHRNTREFLIWCAKWHLDEDKLGLMHDVKEDRVVFPIVHDGKVVDAIGRAIGNRLPKWKRYGKSSLPYVSGHGKVAVVVEDCVSAASVGNDVWCGVAVLGTSLSDTTKQYLSRFSTAIIALDPDALVKGISFVKELRSYVDNVKVVKLTDDLKYRNPTDFKNLAHIGV